jgi:uncharacterized membrane protein
MKRHQPVYLEKVVYNLRGGFLVRPLIIAILLGCAGACLSALEEQYPAIGGLVPKALFPSHLDHQVAQTILSTIATSVMTVVSIVFAILLMSLTLASMQFSPRIIVSFTKDRVTQWTLGVFLGTFSYCLSALPAARSVPAPFSPIATVTGAMLLALISVAWLLFFIHHISQSISVNYIVDRIATETEAVINEMMPLPRRSKRLRLADETPMSITGGAVVSPSSGYIRHIDIDRLMRAAVAYKVTIVVARRVGHFVPAGVLVLNVTNPDKLTPALAEELLALFDIGPTRTLQQDIEFGILQIVDIALRAISPAVNDPSTAICCIDHLSRILIQVGSREESPSRFYSPPGKLRILVPVLGLDRLVHSAFDQIRVYSKGDAAVSLRLLRALTDVSTTVEDPEARRMLAQMGRRILAGVESVLGEDELVEMRERMLGLNKLAIAASHSADELKT